MSGYEFDAPQWLDLQIEAEVYRDEHHEWFRHAHADHERAGHKPQQTRRKRRRSSLALGLRGAEVDAPQKRSGGGLRASLIGHDTATATCHVMSRKETEAATPDAESNRLIQQELEKLKQQQTCDSPNGATLSTETCPGSSDFNTTHGCKLVSNSPTTSRLCLQNSAASAKRLDSRVLRAVRESLSGSSPQRVGRTGLLATQAVHRPPCSTLNPASPISTAAPARYPVPKADEAIPSPDPVHSRGSEYGESSAHDGSGIGDTTTFGNKTAKAKRRSLSTQGARKQRRSLVASARSVLSMEGRGSPTTTNDSNCTRGVESIVERGVDASRKMDDKENSTQARAATASSSRLRLLGSPGAVTRTAARTRRRSGLTHRPITASTSAATTQMSCKDAKRRVAPSDMRDPRANPPAKTAAATSNPSTSSVHSNASASSSATQSSHRRRSLRRSLVAPSSSSTSSASASASSLSTTRAARSSSSSSTARRPSSSRYNLRSSVRAT